MKAFLNWSGGKDATMCLHRARLHGWAVEALVTTVSVDTGRVTMHGVPKELIETQARSLGLPLYFVELPPDGSLQAYEEAVRNMNQRLIAEGFTHVVSGDLFLQDLKEYREQLYAKDGLQCLFPLWGCDTKELLNSFINEGYQALLVVIDEALLSPSFCGKKLDESLLSELPKGVDPCGENGEYHSFVYDGPGFKTAVPFAIRGTVSREYPAPKTGDCFTEPRPPARFLFCDLKIVD